MFPTKADLVRLKKIKCIEVEESHCSMLFEDWVSRNLDKWGLYDIWVRILGCPESLCRDYLALFAVGSLVGKTKEVDMKFTREHGIVRARIDCAMPQGIPRRLDHLYDGEGFGILFDIEAEDGSVVPDGSFDLDDGEGGDDRHETDENEKRQQGKTSAAWKAFTK